MTEKAMKTYQLENTYRFLWEPTNGSARRGRKTITFVDNLREDIELDDINEIKTMMLDRDVWR